MSVQFKSIILNSTANTLYTKDILTLNGVEYPMYSQYPVYYDTLEERIKASNLPLEGVELKIAKTDKEDMLAGSFSIDTLKEYKLLDPTVYHSRNNEEDYNKFIKKYPANQYKILIITSSHMCNNVNIAVPIKEGKKIFEELQEYFATLGNIHTSFVGGSSFLTVKLYLEV